MVKRFPGNETPGTQLPQRPVPIKKEGGVKIHSCGNESPRECQCWQCVSGHCKACLATLL